MKAIMWTKYGPPDGLRLSEVDKPIPKENEVLVKVHAASVTAGDCEIRQLKLPLAIRIPIRFYMGFFNPRNKMLGQELSGVIESVGANVQTFKVGDEVFATTGLSFGAYAEYKCLPVNGVIALKPVNMSHNEAAVVPVGATEALSLLKRGHIQTGQRVLIYGASGSIGTFAVQIAKHFGAEITAVCSAESMDLLRKLGAQSLFDYKKEDMGAFEDSEKQYDIIFDTLGKGPFSRSLRALKTDGRLLLANPKFSQMIRTIWISLTSQKKIIFGPATETPDNLNELKKLIESGDLISVIDRHYPLEETAEAHSYVDKGQKIGNVAITVYNGANS